MKKIIAGSILAFLYTLIVPLANIFRENLIDKDASLVMLCFAFFYSFIFFNLINIKRISNVYKKCLESKYLLIKVNIYIVIIWGCSFLSPLYIGGTYSVLVLFSTVGFFSSCRYLMEMKFLNKLTLGIFIPISLYLASLLLILHDAFLHNKLFGFMLALFSGATSFLYIKDSQKFAAETNFSASEVLAVRYCGFFFFIPFVFFSQKQILYTHLNVHFLRLKHFIYCVSMIITIYFSQKSLSYIDYKLSATIFSFIPCINWFIYLCHGNNSFSSFLVTLSSSFTFLGGATALFYKNEDWLKNLCRTLKLNNKA